MPIAEGPRKRAKSERIYTDEMFSGGDEQMSVEGIRFGSVENGVFRYAGNDG